MHKSFLHHWSMRERERERETEREREREREGMLSWVNLHSEIS